MIPRPAKPPTAPPTRPDAGIVLSVQQEAYCRSRAIGMSVKESAAMADRSVNTARNWEGRPEILSRITHLSGIASNNAIIKVGVDREYVLQKLKSVVERCMQAEPVLDHKGKPTGEYRFDSTGANGALRLLGTEIGMFKDKAPQGEDPFATLSDEELARIATDLVQRVGLLPAPVVDGE